MSGLIPCAHSLRLAMILLALGCLGVAPMAQASSYRQVLKAYQDADYEAAFKAAQSASKKAKGKGKAKILLLGGAAALEIDKAPRAKSMIQKALELDPKIKVPAAIKNKKFKALFTQLQRGGGIDSLDIGGSDDRELVAASSSSSGFSSFQTYLPLGLPQMFHGKYILGFAFGGAQGYLVFNSLQNTSEADKADADAASVIANAKASGDDQTTDFKQFIDDNEAFVKKARAQANLSLGLAAFAYVASVLEAGIFPPGPKRSADLDEEATDQLADSALSIDLALDPRAPIGLALTLRF
jgi:tetratricopeptide (TPR) repeat protein